MRYLWKDSLCKVPGTQSVSTSQFPFCFPSRIWDPASMMESWSHRVTWGNCGTPSVLKELLEGEFWRQPLTCELSVLTGATPPARGPWQANRPQSHLRRHFLGSIPVLSPLNPQALYLLSKCWNWKDPQNFSNTQISLWTEEDTQAEGSWDWSWTTKDGGYPGSRSLGS